MAAQAGFLRSGIVACVSCRCLAVIRCDRRRLSDCSAGSGDGVLGVGGLDAVGLSWTSWDMIEKVCRADQGFRGITDAGRTERGFHAIGNGKIRTSVAIPMGRDRLTVKPVGSAYVGSNPTPANTCENGPLAANSRAGGRFFSVPVCLTLLRCRPWRCGVHGRIAYGTRGQGAVWVAA